MTVQIATRDDVTWYEFPGREVYEGEDDPTETYRARVVMGEIRFDLGLEEPPNYPQLQVPVDLFKAVVLSLEGAKHGVFHRHGDEVTFVLPCGESHKFKLEDLLILVDQL